VSPSPKPEFLTNRAGEQVADALRSYFAHLRTNLAAPYDLAVATAYFNVGGWKLLASELDHPRRVRLLLGAEPLIPDRRVRPLDEPAHPTRAHQARLRGALATHEDGLERDRDLLGFTVEADRAACELVAWLQTDGVEVRRLEDEFLHGKAFLVTAGDEGVIAGSANFTFAGLSRNLELNLGHYQPHVVAQVADWFDELWDRAAPFDLASLYEERYEPHSPWLIYLRMLWERYGAELEAEAGDTGASRIQLTTFQRDGLWRAKRILDRHHGVLVADEVGLGKTFLAGELIREAVQERRQRALVIAPATLRDGPWAKFSLTYQLGVELLSFDDLVAGKLAFPAEQYAMVVIDEAHALRNPSTQRAEALRWLLAGSPPKDLVLLTATPVNNGLWDLYNLLAYFLPNDAAFADIGMPSLRDHFAKAMALNPDDLKPDHLFDVLDEIAVRRTRPFVKTYYPNDTVRIDGQQVTITFPTPRPIQVDYDLSEVFGDFLDRFAAALPGPDDEADPVTSEARVLTLARYAPSRYRLAGDAEAYELQLAGLLRSGLLKRFESSAHAFGQTCRKMAASHDGFLALIDEGWVGTGRTLAEWMATDSDELDDLETFVDRHHADLDAAGDYDLDALRSDVESDRELLLEFAAEADRVHRENDPKLAALIEELAVIAEQAHAEGIGEADTRDKRKVLIFSYFTDTVDWIIEHLERAVLLDDRLADYRGRLIAATGSSGTKEDALWGFAPRTTDPPANRTDDLYDVVVATDVLAEGVNLQQARHILNYDLPWNPMRLVQRHGRVDRIGSSHREVFLRCVFPDRQLDALLGLEERLMRKLKHAAKAVGVADGVLPGAAAATGIVFAETRDEIEALKAELDRIRTGDATLFEEAGESGGALSGEEYRKALQRALEEPATADQVKGLPWGSGSGIARAHADPGYVFCIRVGDHHKPLFRYVGYPAEGEPVVVGDTLACLAHARSDEGTKTPRVLDDATHERAYSAWAMAREDILRRWTAATDPANLQPSIPRALRDAAALVRAHPPADTTQDAVDALIDALEAPHPQRVQRDLRAAMRTSTSPREQAVAVAERVRQLGLHPAPAPDPLPVITADDIHLVCWLAISPMPASLEPA
jgi:hypothetical protein